VLANGPLRFRFALLGKVREHHVRQIVTIDKGEPVMRMQTTVDCVDDCGRFWVKFGCDKEADVRVGIPFGEETRDLSVEKYVVEDPECMVEGMFFYGDYIKAKNGGRECCIVNGDLSTYAKLTDDGVCLFLRRMMGRNFNDDSEVGAWYNQCDRYIKATGVMEYEYGLCPFGTTTAPAVTAKDFIVGTDFVKKYATAGDLPANGSLLALESDGVALSSLRDTENGVELRIFEALGKGGALHIKHGFDTATAVDLNGNALVEPVDEIKPYQIKTILFK
jgi:alpha-mannosidase